MIPSPLDLNAACLAETGDRTHDLQHANHYTTDDHLFCSLKQVLILICLSIFILLTTLKKDRQ